MTGFLKRLFSGKDKNGADVAGGTKRINKPAVTDKHVQSLQSFRTSKPRGSEEPDTDTGPWYIGKTVADIFEIRGVLGRGGMGIVYQAHDNATQRKIAVKVPLGKFVDDEDAKKRFTREAEAWMGLVHPHIVHAFDVRDEQSTDYRPAIFMDYCDGGSLSDRLYNGQRLSMTEALDIAIQVCWAMEFAHEKDHIHRDLKPGNVLLTSDGKALVTDFGLVKMLDTEDIEQDSDQLSEVDAQVLASISQVSGTPEYMAPEQWEGKAERRSDIYAFGVMLYELFCGCRPFKAESRIALLVPHMQISPPDPKQFNGRIPDGLANLMQLCLAKRPCDRPKDFCDLANKLLNTYTVVAKNENLPSQYNRTKPQERDISRADKGARAWALLRLGLGCQLRGNWPEMERHCAQSLEIFQELEEKNGIATCFNLTGCMVMNRGEYEDARGLFRKAMAIFEAISNKVGVGGCYGNMGLLAENIGDYDTALELFHKSMAVYKDLGYKDGMALTYGNMGMMARNRGDYDAAMELYGKSMTIHGLGNKSGVGRCYLSMGEALGARGEYDLGLKHLRKALKIFEELGDRAAMGKCYNNMGLIAKNYSKYDAAIEFYCKFLVICEDLPDRLGMAQAYTNMGVVAWNLGEHKEALNLYTKSLAIFKELGNIPLMGKCYGNMGLVASDRGEYDQAMKYYKQSLAIKQKLIDKAGMGVCYTNMGIVAKNQGHYDDARKFYRKSLSIFEELNNKAFMQKCYMNMGILAMARNNFSEAMEMYRKSLVICEEQNDKVGMGQLYWRMSGTAHSIGDYNLMRACAQKAVKLLDEVGVPIPEELQNIAFS